MEDFLNRKSNMSAGNFQRRIVTYKFKFADIGNANTDENNS